MASLFVIREKNTGTYCTSSRYRTFHTDLQAAAMFNSEKNALKAIRGMFPKELNLHGGSHWTACTDDTVTEYHDAFLNEYIEALENHFKTNPSDHNKSMVDYLKNDVTEKKCDMEVVEVKLTLV